MKAMSSWLWQEKSKESQEVCSLEELEKMQLLGITSCEKVLSQVLNENIKL